MRLHYTLLGLALLTACGGSEEQPTVESEREPLLYRTVIEANGIPFEISWDRNNRTQATARVYGVSQEVAIDPTNIVVQATGCRVTSSPTRVPSTDGVATYLAAINCTPAKVQTDVENESSRQLAREIDLALNRVAEDRVASNEPLTSTSTRSEAPLVVSYYEGSPFSAFSATDIERLCAEPWETRISADGRTEYNPCKRRDAFR